MAGASEINAAGASLSVSSALTTASQRTGADFDYLYKVALRESSLNPAAKAKTSSAAGLFQFIEQTWLGTVKTYGARHGLADEASAITRGANGRFTVSDPAQKENILALRFDSEKASLLAGELANENRRFLEKALGRNVQPAEVYAAHFLGPAGAAKLLSAPANAEAAALFGAAATANKPVFFDGARAKTVSEVIGDFERTISSASAALQSMPQAEQFQPSISRVLPELSDTSAVSAQRSDRSDQNVAVFARPEGRLPDPASRVSARLQNNNASIGVNIADLSRLADATGAPPLAFVVLQALDPTLLNRDTERYSNNTR